MKFSILDVPESLANHSEVHEGGGETQYVPNPDPDTEPSIYTPRAEAHQLIYDLAVQDGWAALYDPTNADSLIYSGGSIVGIRDSLGNYPDLASLGSNGSPSGSITLKTIGALRYGEGFVGATTDILPSNFSVMTLNITNAASGNSIFWGDIDLTSAAPRAAASAHPPGGAYYLTSSTPSFSGETSYGGQEDGQILLWNSQTGKITSGYREVDLPPGGPGPSSDPVAGIYFGHHPLFGSGGAGFGPTLFADGEVDPEAHQRMVALLSRLSGATVGTPNPQYEPAAWVTLDQDGNRTAGHMPHKPEQLASVTKLMTTYVAYKILQEYNINLNNRIVVSQQFVPEPTSRAPVVYQGTDEISWTDAFHASLMVSHNHLTDTIAFRAGRLKWSNAVNPAAALVDEMNRIAVSDWGWTEAVFTTPQGRYNSILTPTHVAELLLKIRQETPWLMEIMQKKTAPYTVYSDNAVRLEGTFENFVQTEYQNTILFPEIIGGKGGDTPSPAKRAMAMLWNNPDTQKVNATAVLTGLGFTGAEKYYALREKMSTSRPQYPNPWGYAGQNGTLIGFQRSGTTNYITATQHYPEMGQDLYVSPLSPDAVSRPVVRKGDRISVSVDVRGISGSTVEATLQVIGGSLESSPVYTLKRSMNGNWSTMTFTRTVDQGGYLDFHLTQFGGGDNPWMNLKEVQVTVNSDDVVVYEYSMDVETFSVSESSQSHDSNDSSGTVGEFDVQVKKPFMDSIFSEYGHGYIRNKRVRLDTWYGSLFGTANGISQANDYSMTISGVSEMGPLNAYNITAPPYTGTLVGLLEVYFSLISNAAPEFSAHPDLIGRTITAPGWKGELWYHLKLLCAAERIQIALRPGGGVRVTPSVHHELEHVPLSDLGVTFQETGLAEAVEVYHYGSQWVNNGLIYPSGGWHEEVEILSVNAGEIAEQTLELSASLESFVPPQMVEYVGKDEEDKSVYTIVGDDGFPIKPDQWADNGGKVEFELGEDTRTIRVTMTGAVGIRNDQGELMRSFSLALASDTSGSRYSTLRILGTGVVFDRREVRFPTGVPSELTGTEIGATIDNPFISTMGQAAQAGSLAAYKFAGAAPELSQTSLGPHLGQWGTDVLSGMITSDIANYRVREVTYTPEGASLTGDYYLTYDHFKFNGTYDEFNTANDGLTYDDVQARGNKYE